MCDDVVRCRWVPGAAPQDADATRQQPRHGALALWSDPVRTLADVAKAHRSVAGHCCRTVNVLLDRLRSWDTHPDGGASCHARCTPHTTPLNAI